MGQKQSKDKLLYQKVIEGDVEAIKALHGHGAKLEWMDKKGKTALIVASMDSGRFPVAMTLIELGANVNAYRPGRHGGTPLHHASKKGLDQTVRLLLSHGANPFLANDDCQTPLDVSRARGFSNVVRTIEGHICTFSGSVREIFVPRLLGALAPKLLTREVWAVVIPSDPKNSSSPSRSELAIYQTPQDAQPRTVIDISGSKVESPKFHHSNPILIIHDQSTKHRYKFGSAIEGDKQQVWQLYNACTGARPLPSLLAASGPSAGTCDAASASSVHPTSSNDQSVAKPPTTTPQAFPVASGTNGWGTDHASDAAGDNGWPVPSTSSANANAWLAEPPRPAEYNGWDIPDGKARPGPHPQLDAKVTTSHVAPVASSELSPSVSSATPTAPPLPDDGPIHYPTIDLSPVDLPISDIDHDKVSAGKGSTRVAESSACVICLDAPVEGACVPCGHMAGCMACLKKIEEKKGDCPVCRSKMERIVRLYAV